MPHNNYWKFLNQLKDTFSRLTADKSLQTDIFQILNKISQPNELSEYMKSTEKKISSVQQSVQKMYSLGTTSALNILEKKDSNIDETKSSWKEVKRVTQSQHFLDKNRILNIFKGIESASNEGQIAECVELLIAHLRQYPEVRNIAVKHGAIRNLLKKRMKISSDPVKSSIREALAILGYSDPVPKRGIRILSIDGGGIRGVLVLEMLKKLEELTGKRTYELFDFFCGVSTGAVLTFSMGVHLRDLDDIIKRYEALSQQIFNQSRLLGTGKLMWSHAYYDTALWESKLMDYLGTDRLISTSRNPHCPKICVVSAIVNQSQVSAYAFRNYALPWRFQSEYDGTYEAEIWQAARASAAAPTYFEEFRINDLIHQVFRLKASVTFFK